MCYSTSRRPLAFTLSVTVREGCYILALSAIPRAGRFVFQVCLTYFSTWPDPGTQLVARGLVAWLRHHVGPQDEKSRKSILFRENKFLETGTEKSKPVSLLCLNVGFKQSCCLFDLQKKILTIVIDVVSLNFLKLFPGSRNSVWIFTDTLQYRLWIDGFKKKTGRSLGKRM